MRQLVKAMIRGMIMDHDVPSEPMVATNDADLSRGDYLMFFKLMDEVYAEIGETRKSVLEEVERLRENCLEAEEG